MEKSDELLQANNRVNLISCSLVSGLINANSLTKRSVAFVNIRLSNSTEQHEFLVSKEGLYFSILNLFNASN